MDLGLACLETRLLVRIIPVLDDARTKVGLCILVAACQLGYIGVWEIALGAIAVWPFIVAASIAAPPLLLAQRRIKREEIKSSPRSLITRWKRPSLPSIIIGCTAVITCGLCCLHAGSQPITEFDSLIYHAELPRTWFAHAPSPPLEYGPSIGVEISANYPPLWPALGASIYVLTGSADDLFLRLISPLLLVALLLVVAGVTSRLFGSSAARWSILLLLGAPLLVFYAMWPTNYLLLSALVTLTLLLLLIARDSASKTALIAAAAFGGLAALTNFYGWIVVVLGLFLAASPRMGKRRHILVFQYLSVALLIPGVWLVRNSILLGDPVYPLAIGILHDRGIVPSIWRATEAQVRRTAESSLFGSGQFSVRIRAVASSLWNRELIPVGVLPGVVALSYLSVRRVALRLVAVGVAGWLLITISPGWYFYRALLPVMPIVAIGCGVAISEITGARPTSGSAESDAPPGSRLSTICARAGRAILAIIVFSLCASVGIGLAATAPNQLAGSPTLTSRDWELGLRDLGSTSQTLWAATGGDSLAWDWLNTHVRRNAKVATLEVRGYYIANPSAFFYLDGAESAALLDRRTPQSALAFLQGHGVSYILIPAWASASPVLGLLPLSQFLGSAQFPLTASFAPYDSAPLTQIYHVGPTITQYSPAVYPGYDVTAPRLDRYVLADHITASIFLSDVPTYRRLALSFGMRTEGASRLTLRLGSTLLASIHERNSAWTTAAVSFVTAVPDPALTIDVTGAPVHLTNVRITG